MGENLGVERAPIEVREDGLRHSVQIGDAVDFEIEDVVPFGVRDRRAGPETHRDLPPGGQRADNRSRDAFEDRCVRHQLRGKGGLLHLGVLVGGVSAASAVLRSRPSGPPAASRRRSLRGGDWPSSRCCSGWRPSRGGRRPTAWPGWTPARGPTSGRWAGSSASGS